MKILQDNLMRSIRFIIIVFLISISILLNACFGDNYNSPTFEVSVKEHKRFYEANKECLSKVVANFRKKEELSGRLFYGRQIDSIMNELGCQIDYYRITRIGFFSTNGKISVDLSLNVEVRKCSELFLVFSEKEITDKKGRNNRIDENWFIVEGTKSPCW
jgi:hypothetical protein